MESDGGIKCGEDGCNGVVTTAGAVWKKAQVSEQDIISAMGEVEKLSKMVTSPELTLTSFGVWFWLRAEGEIITCVFLSGVGG